MSLTRRISQVLEHGLDADRVDFAQGIVYGAKIAGLQSLHGRDYTDETYQKSFNEYEGAVGYLNHAGGPSGRKRSVEDAFCVYHNPRPVPGDGVRADVHVLDPEEPFARKFLKAAASKDHAKHRAFSFSHDAQITSRPGRTGRQIVESIDKVQSVDVVPRGATTKGIYESSDLTAGDDMVHQIDGGPDYGEHLCNAAHAVMAHPNIHPKEKLRKIHTLLKAQYGSGLDGTGAADESPEDAEEPKDKAKSEKGGKKRGASDEDEDMFDEETRKSKYGGTIEGEDDEKRQLREEVAAGKVREWVREQAEPLGIKASAELMKQCVQEAADPLKVAGMLLAELAKSKKRQAAAPKSVSYGATKTVQESAADERPKDLRDSLSRWAPGAVRRMVQES